MATTEIRGVGHSVQRKEDAALHPRQGQLLRRHQAAGDALPGAPAQPVRARAHQLDRRLARPGRCPASSPSSPASCMAQHNLAWMPTLSGDTQAVLATDKVRFQGQEVAAVVAETPYVAKDALELIEVDYEPLPAVTHAAAGARGGRAAHPRRQGGAGRELDLPLGGRRQGGDRPGLRRGRPGRLARHLLPALPPGAARVLRLRRRREPGHRQGDDLHDLAGPARAPDAVRARRRACPSTRSGSSRRTSAAASGTRCRSTPATSSRPRPRSCSASPSSGSRTAPAT